MSWFFKIFLIAASCRMVTALFGDGLGMTGNLEKEIKESILFCVM